MGPSQSILLPGQVMSGLVQSMSAQGQSIQMQNQGMQGQGIANQGQGIQVQGQGMQGQGMQNQGMQMQGQGMQIQGQGMQIQGIWGMYGSGKLGYNPMAFQNSNQTMRYNNFMPYDMPAMMPMPWMNMQQYGSIRKIKYIHQ